MIHNATLLAQGKLDIKLNQLKFVRAEVRDGTDSVLGITNPIFFQ